MNHAFDQAMAAALMEARAAGESGDIPIGAVVLNAVGDVIARGGNARELLQDPTAHAEVRVLRDAAQVLGDWRLTECTLVVTLEPCPMCAGAEMRLAPPQPFRSAGPASDSEADLEDNL